MKEHVSPFPSDQTFDPSWESHQRYGGRVVPTDDPNVLVIARVEYRVYKQTESPKGGNHRWKRVFTTFSCWTMEHFVRSGFRPHFSFTGCTNRP